MKYKLVLTSMVMGAIVCSTSAVVGAANVAPQVSDTAKHEAVQSNWMDRTDIAVGVQTGGQSKLDKGHFLTDDQNSIYNKQSDYGNLTKAYIETLQPISHYDENSKSVLFVQGRIGRGGEKIASKEMRGYFINEPIMTRHGYLSSYTIKNTDEKWLSVKCWGIHPTSLLWHQSYVWLVPFFLLKSRIRTLNLPKWRSP